MSKRWILSAVLFGAMATAILACESPGEGPVPIPGEADFEGPIAEAREKGITPYWLGEEFDAGPLTFQLQEDADLIERFEGTYTLDVEYSAGIGEGNVTLRMDIYRRGSDGAHLAREGALGIDDTSSESIPVGDEYAELLTTRGLDGSVDKVLIIVGKGDVQAFTYVQSGHPRSGGQDNPLLDSRLLASVLADNLRPYPD